MTAVERALYRESTTDVRACIWEADPETFQFTYVSHGAERLFGYTLEQWLTRTTFWVDMLHPDDREAAASYCRAAVRDGRDHEFEYRAITADHRVVWIRDIVRVIRDETKPVALRGAMLDITDRKHAEAAAQRTDQYVRALIEHSADIITVINREGRVLYDSPSASHVMGHPSDYRIGRRVFETVHREDLPRTLVAVERVFESTAPTSPFQFRYRHASGAWRTLEALGHSFIDETGKLVGIVNARDVTDRIAHEEETRHAQKMEAIGRLTGSIAHDFNNLLTAILGNVELAITSEFSIGIRPQLTEIRQASTLANSLVRQLLLFSDKRRVKGDVVDVSSTLERLGGILRRLTGPGIALRLVTGEPGEACVRLFEGHLEQVIMNLVTNARDAMPHGGTLYVIVGQTTEMLADGTLKDFVTVEVADMGVGMTRDVRARLFEPFFTTKEPGTGTGLGLPIVYGIVTDAGGSIEVHSEIDQGTRVVVHLPRVPAS